jgi:hypothetical protein
MTDSNIPSFHHSIVKASILKFELQSEKFFWSPRCKYDEAFYYVYSLKYFLQK